MFVKLRTLLHTAKYIIEKKMELLVHPHCGNMHTAAMQPANCHPLSYTEAAGKFSGTPPDGCMRIPLKKAAGVAYCKRYSCLPVKKTVLNYIRTHVLKCRLLFFFSQTDYDAILVVLAKRLHGVTFVRILNT